MVVPLLATLQGRIAHANASAAFPTPYNGTLGAVDMSKPVDYVEDMGKVVLRAANYDLKATMKYLIWVVQGKPALADAPALTQDDIDKLHVPFLQAIARERIYTVMNKAQVLPTFRSSDTVTLDATANYYQNDRAMNEIYALYTGTAEKDSAVATEGQFMLLSIVANAIHREQNKGHNWFTDKTDQKGTLTFKACAVAGIDTAKFMAWMKLHGHDVNHHLPDSKLNDMALALTGKEEATARSRVPAAGAGANAAAGPGDMYAGQDIRGCTVYEIFNLDEAACDRYPPSELGKSALIVGLDHTGSMVTAICAKVLVAGADTISGNLEALANHLRANDVGRNSLRSLETSFGKVMSFAHGFHIENDTLVKETFPAYDNHASRYPGDQVDGQALAKVLKSIQAHPKAVETAIVNLINRIGSSVTSLIANPAINTAAIGLAAHVPAGVTVEVAENEGDRMTRMIAAMRAP
jgi:hypothetical protein